MQILHFNHKTSILIGAFWGLTTCIPVFSEILPHDALSREWSEACKALGDGAEEWSLLTRCAEAQLLAGEAGGGHFILPTLMNSNQVATSRFAIPALALALRAKQVGLKVCYGREHQLHGKVWRAVVNLQKLTGESVGATTVVPNAGGWQRVTAQVEEWWDRTGKLQFTFERIAEMQRQR